ncbi:MAG: glycosyltransferase family protein [Thermoguttaceae bacterium]
MADFYQHGLIATIHDLGTIQRDHLEEMLERFVTNCPVGLILPVTAADMRAEPFAKIVEDLAHVRYLQHVVVVLGMSQGVDDFREAVGRIRGLGDRARVLWTDGPRVEGLYRQLHDAGLAVGAAGKGRSVWTAFGYLLADPWLKVFALHDCDIVNYDRELLARLCLPLVHPGTDFEFCKAYYARISDRMHGRVVRLFVSPLLQALISLFGYDRFLVYLDSFRYPLSGEFAVMSDLAKSNRIPSDWGLEVGTLAEVFRNTSVKRVCQVDVCRRYEHKHQSLSLDDPGKGLMKMAVDIVISIFRNLASMGKVLQSGDMITLRSAYLRSAQDAIRNYHADALMNGLVFDRHEEEQAIEAFSRQIAVAGEMFQREPAGGEAIPNWVRVVSAFPDFPQHLRRAAEEDLREYVN